MTEARWAKRTAQPFHEAAEVLGVDTDLIMSTMEDDAGRMRVLYSPDRDDAERVFGVLLSRADDDTLVPITDPVEIPGMFEEIRRRMDKA